MIQKVKDRSLYRAIDIQYNILRDHGVSLSYKKAWMGKEIAQGVLLRSEVESYDLLLWYTSKVMEMNLGSSAIVKKTGERFKCTFFSFYACVVAIKSGCRLLLFIDGTHLVGKYVGTLLGVISKDGNYNFFHVTFAIINNGTHANWMWFLLKIGDGLYRDDDYEKIIKFVYDISKDLVSANREGFSFFPHAYCLRHLEGNFMKRMLDLGRY